MIEDFVLDEIEATEIHKDIKGVDKSIDALRFDEGIED
jgi:hypothetical protein